MNMHLGKPVFYIIRVASGVRKINDYVALRSWGHLSFLYYMVKTDHMLHIIWLKNIFSDLPRYICILTANLSEIETLISHL